MPSGADRASASAAQEAGPHQRQDLATWIKNNLDGCMDPRAFGKGLTANHSGEWRYRVGSYRILALIHDDVVTIEVFSIGRRDTVYEG